MSERSLFHTLATREFLLLVVALAFWWPCIVQTDFYAPRGIADTAQPLFATARFVFPLIVVVLVLLEMAFPLLKRASSKRSVICLLGVFGSCAYLAQTAGGLSTYSALVFSAQEVSLLGIVGIICSACFLICITSSWLGRALLLDMRALLVGIALSYALCELMQVALLVAPLFARFAYRLACPLLAGVLLGAAGSPAQTPDVASPREPQRLAPLVLLLVLTLVFICFEETFSLMLNAAQQQNGFRRSAGVPLISLAFMCLAAFIFSRTSNESCRGLIVVFVSLSVVYMAAFLCTAVAPETRSLANDSFMVAIGHCYRAFCLMALAWGAKNRLLRPNVSAGLQVLIVIAVPLLLHNYLTGFMDLHALDDATVVRAAAVALFVVALVLLALIILMSRREMPLEQRSQEEWLQEHCAQATAPFGLTPKELEVTVLVYRGFTIKATAEALGISANTADTHLKHVYRKMGLHSKQELIDTIDATNIP